MQKALNLALLLTKPYEKPATILAAMIYDLSEAELPSESDLPFLEDTDSPHPIIIDEIRSAYTEDEIVQRIIKAKLGGLRKIPYDITKNHFKLELGDCQVIDNLLYVRDRLYVPPSKDKTVYARIIKEVHTSLPGRHAGRSSTYDSLSRWYYWPRMTDMVARFVRSCDIWNRSKSYREGKQGLLKPLPIPDRYWTDISLDFITPLPISLRHGRKYQHIMVVVDRLSKKKKIVPLDSLEVEAVVQAFIEWIWREEGYPRTVTSDRGTQFTSHFWRRLCQRIGTKPKMPTAFHPETDGQTESANSALKQYLRAYVNYEQDNWVDLLPIAEFEANSDRNDSSGIAPFFATKEYHPRSGLEPPSPIEKSLLPTAKKEIKASDGFVEKIDRLRKHLREDLKWSQAIQSEQANRNRQPAPEFKVGGMVMLNARNIRTIRANKSLDHKNLGPFKIVRTINNSAYELDLPQSMSGIFPVFYPWLLHLDKSNPLPGQIIPPPPPIWFDEEVGLGEYIAEDILLAYA